MSCHFQVQKSLTAPESIKSSMVMELDRFDRVTVIHRLCGVTFSPKSESCLRSHISNQPCLEPHERSTHEAPSASQDERGP